MNKKLLVFFPIFLFFIPFVSASCEVTPGEINLGNAKAGDVLQTALTITATNETCEISSSSTWVYFDKSVVSNGTDTVTVSIIIPSSALPKDYTIPINVNDATANIIFTIVAEEGMLRPTFTSQKMSIEQGAKSTQFLTVRNMYDDEIEITSIEIEGKTVLTKEGIRKPLDIIEKKTGFLPKGSDMTITLGINTEGVDPGAYPVNIIFTYYYKNSQKVLRIPFEITVQPSVSGGSAGKLYISFSNDNPNPGDIVSVFVTDEFNNTVTDADIECKVYGPDGSLETTFKVSGNFLVASGRKYCVKATKEGYEEIEKCFSVKESHLSLKFSNPSPGVNESIMIQLVDDSGNIVSNGKIIIDGKDYGVPQITVSFDSGTHTVTGKADGYEDVSRTITVQLPLEVVEFKDKINVKEKMNVTFNRPTNWEIVKNGTVIASGSSSVINAQINEPGVYEVYAEGSKVGEVIVEQGFEVPSFLNATNITIFVIVIFVGFLAFKFINRPKKKRIGFSPYSDSGPVQSI